MRERPLILFVDDDVKAGELMLRFAADAPFDCRVFRDPRQALDYFERHGAELVISDLRMPGLSGIELLAQLRRHDADVPVIFVTAYSSVDHAIEALRLGATDFIKKPFDMDELVIQVENTLERTRLRQENRILRRQLRDQDARFGMIGQSPAMYRVLAMIGKVSDIRCNVIITGESGTGKELAARFLHENSSRRQKPFVTVECSGLSDTIFESELFGHVKGSFTGAINNKPGLIDSAEGGTLFLDEVGDIPLSQQVKLLRLIETGIYRPVGSVENRFADFRLVCATNRDLAAMVAAGEFREDLFYRINGFPVLLPPLRERRDDVLLLAKSLLRDLSGNLLLHFSEAAQDFLLGYAFPGNIRELRNLVERATLLCSGNRIELDHVLPPQLPPARPGPIGTDSWQTLGDNAIIPLQHLEARYLQHLDNTFSGGKSELAAKLGISERTLYRKLQKTSKQ